MFSIKKFKQFIEQVLKAIKPLIDFFLISSYLYFAFCYFGYIDSDYDTAYAYNANDFETDNYSQISGLVVYTPSNRFVLENADSYLYNLNVRSTTETVLFRLNMPVQIIEQGVNLLYVYCPSTVDYIEFDYQVTLYNGNVFSGNVVFDSISDISVFGLIEREHQIPSSMFYRVDYLDLRYCLDSPKSDSYLFSIDYDNDSVFTYNDFISRQRDFVSHLDSLLSASVRDIGDQIVDFAEKLTNIEIFPDFSILSLLVIYLGISIGMAVAKLWLGG